MNAGRINCKIIPRTKNPLGDPNDRIGNNNQRIRNSLEIYWKRIIDFWLGNRLFKRNTSLKNKIAIFRELPAKMKNLLLFTL